MSRDRHDDPGWGMSSWMGAYYGQGTSFLTERSVRRVAQYYRSIANLTRQGSAEPRLWIGALQAFWSGMADDYGDSMRRYGGYDEGEDPIEVAAGGPLMVTVRINEDAKTDQQSFDLPTNLFDSTMKKARLTTQGLFIGDRCVLRPGHNLLIEPPKEVTRDDRACKLRFMNLPEELTAGTTLVGTVVAEPVQTEPEQGSSSKAESAKRPPVLVAVIQARVI